MHFIHFARAGVSPGRGGLYLSISMEIFDFAGAAKGMWQVTSQVPVVGAALPTFGALTISEGTLSSQPAADWFIKGARSNMRYTHRSEAEVLTRQQAPLGRPEAICAALIPIKKNDAWWALPQDERRKLFEDQSRHIAIGLDYLPAIARRLYHSRDLGQAFDFLTWFEYAPADAAAFEKLVHLLRQTVEWEFVLHEVDIRLKRL